jgi:hypothetical protein
MNILLFFRSRGLYNSLYIFLLTFGLKYDIIDKRTILYKNQEGDNIWLIVDILQELKI